MVKKKTPRRAALGPPGQPSEAWIVCSRAGCKKIVSTLEASAYIVTVDGRQITAYQCPSCKAETQT